MLKTSIVKEEMPNEPIKILDSVQVGLSLDTLMTKVKLSSLERASLRYIKFYVSSIEKIIVSIDDIEVTAE